jgi:hypothetical protein
LQVGDYTSGPIQAYCAPPALTPATVSLGSNRGTVQSMISYTLRYYPIETTVALLWDGKSLGSVATNADGIATSSLAAPAAPMGTHKIQWAVGTWRSAATFTIVPRIKLIPNAVSRGQLVNVSLRGYAARETVRIRWKKGTSWIEIARVTTSSTGSANINIKVPTWAPYGPNSVRGDGSFGHAQTNAVSVLQPSFGSVAQPTPTQTPTPAPTAIPATAIPSPTSTPSPTVDVTTPDATATPTETETTTPDPAPDETATPLPVTETPTPQPTAEATTEPSPGAPAPGEEAG